MSVCSDDIGEFMQQYAKEHFIQDVLHDLLIGFYFGKKTGLSTPLLMSSNISPMQLSTVS